MSIMDLRHLYTSQTHYGDVAKAVRAFRDANPEYDVVFSVTLKDMPMVK